MQASRVIRFHSSHAHKTPSTGAVSASYVYNGSGQRVSKVTPLVPTGRTVYAYDEEGRVIGEYYGDGQVQQETVYLGNLPVAVLRPGTGTTDALAQVFYVYLDHINTPRVITSAATGNIVWRWDSTDPFGLGQANENPGAEGAFVYDLRFPGQIFDRETSNHYNYYRDYDPQTGRYAQSDPIGLKGGINTYAYVGGNPLSFVDSFGLAIDCKVVGKFGLFNVEKCQETGEAPSEQDAKDAKRMSDNQLEKACKNNGFDDAHDMKRKMGLDSKSDIFKDKNGNMYSGARQGSRVPEYLNMNIYGK